MRNMWKIILFLVLQAPAFVSSHLVLKTAFSLTVSAIDCLSENDITFFFTSKDTNITITVAECDRSINSCYLLNQSNHGELYSVNFIGGGGQFTTRKDNSKTWGQYMCCETHNTSSCQSMEISSSIISSTDANTDRNNNSLGYMDDCAPKPCQNGATCSDLVNGYTCKCAAGFNGNNCETNINECAPMPCKNGATCIDGINAYTCNCVAGWAGNNCDQNVNECAPMPCKNGATCIDEINAYSCNCVADWTGNNCDQTSSTLGTVAIVVAVLAFVVAIIVALAVKFKKRLRLCCKNRRLDTTQTVASFVPVDDEDATFCMIEQDDNDATARMIEQPKGELVPLNSTRARAEQESVTVNLTVNLNTRCQCSQDGEEVTSHVIETSNSEVTPTECTDKKKSLIVNLNTPCQSSQSKDKSKTSTTHVSPVKTVAPKHVQQNVNNAVSRQTSEEETQMPFDNAADDFISLQRTPAIVSENADDKSKTDIQVLGVQLT